MTDPKEVYQKALSLSNSFHSLIHELPEDEPHGLYSKILDETEKMITFIEAGCVISNLHENIRAFEEGVYEVLNLKRSLEVSQHHGYFKKDTLKQVESTIEEILNLLKKEIISLRYLDTTLEESFVYYQNYQRKHHPLTILQDVKLRSKPYDIYELIDTSRIIGISLNTSA